MTDDFFGFKFLRRTVGVEHFMRFQSEKLNAVF